MCSSTLVILTFGLIQGMTLTFENWLPWQMVDSFFTTIVSNQMISSGRQCFSYKYNPLHSAFGTFVELHDATGSVKCDS
jgi:hypothetical protein